MAVVNSTRKLAWHARQAMILAKEGFADARIADDDDVGAVADKLEIHEPQDPALQLNA